MLCVTVKTISVMPACFPHEKFRICSSKQGLMCLAQGHNAVTPIRLEPTALRSQVKRSNTEPLRFPICCCILKASIANKEDSNQTAPYILNYVHDVCMQFKIKQLPSVYGISAVDPDQTAP